MSAGKGLVRVMDPKSPPAFLDSESSENSPTALPKSAPERSFFTRSAEKVLACSSLRLYSQCAAAIASRAACLRACADAPVALIEGQNPMVITFTLADSQRLLFAS